MRVAILANDEQREAWLQKPANDKITIEWAGSMRILTASIADVYIDLLFEPDPERIIKLSMRKQALVLVNEVIHTAGQLGSWMVRINGWPGFWERNLLEAATAHEDNRKPAEDLFEKLGWPLQWVPDISGLVTPRIVAGIINEAYYTLGDGISGKEEIDTAMKLGTNYPMGPFAWAEKVGKKRIYSLLSHLAKTDSRYTPAPALENEVLMQSVQW